MHRVLDGADLFLTDLEVDAFENSVSVFLVALQDIAQKDKINIWKLRPKHHMLEHVAYDLRHKSRINPKRVTCLLEEDFLGLMKNIGCFCRGLDPVGMMPRIQQRYLLNLKLRWKRRQRTGLCKVACR